MPTERVPVSKGPRLASLRQASAARLAAALLLLTGLLASLDGSRLWAALDRFDTRYLPAMALIFLAALILFAWRWWLIAGRLGLRAPYRAFLSAVWISQFAGEIGPPLILGELARYHGLRGYGEPWQRAAGQAVDRWSGQAVLWLLAALILPLYLPRFMELGGARLLALGIILAASLGVAAYAAWRLLPVARSRIRAVADACHPWRAPGHYGLSLLLQGLLSLNLVLAGAALGHGDHWPDLLLLGPLLLLGVGSLPSLVSDWGKREAAAVVLLAPAGLQPEESLAVALAYGVAQCLAALPGGLLWGLARPDPNRDLAA